MYLICHDIDMRAFAEDIYFLISTPEGLNKWWTVRSEGILAQNEEYQFYFSDEYDWKGEILEFTPNESISYFMTQADSDWKGTMLSFELIHKEDHYYTLRFEHRNWKEINSHFRRTSYCWALYLNTLKEQAESLFKLKA